jgi:hypothetical protein
MAFVKKNKKNKIDYTFLALPLHVLKSKSYINLNAHSKVLLIDIFMQYQGKNNGDLCVARKILEPRGWKSRSKLFKCLKELLDNRLIELTRQGHTNLCSLYAVTWLAVDECNGKLDVKPTNKPSNNLKDN